MPQRDVPCEPWTTATEVRECYACASVADVEDTALTDMIEVASAWLYRGSGRRFSGQCSVTVRPVAACGTTLDVGRYFDSATGTWRPAPAYRPGRREGAEEVGLGFWPVHSITEVRIDGAVLASSAYRLDDSEFLVRIDGNSWPSWQDWTGDSLTDPNTWQVSLLYGDDPPADGVLAAKVLSCELALAHQGSSQCRLPPRVTNVARGGTNIAVADPLSERETFGIPEVDYFLRTVNPHNLAERSAFVNVDVPREVRRAGTDPGS